MELPSASDYPDYYQTIRHPISLYIIEERLERGRYSEVSDLKRDLEMVCNNAKRYNMRDTPIWTKAKHLHALIKDAYSDVIELGRCSSPLGGPASPSQSRLALSQQPGGLAALRPAGSGEIAADADGEAESEGDEDAEGESETEIVKEPTSMRIRIKGALGRKMPNEERLARPEGGEAVSSGGKSLKDAFKEVIADLNAAVSAE
ncbi:Bromodomain-containing protein [Ceraceosorus guamensis]|uniref:Bromodomain-containing protein n=1 Tax=Ceraceosorus guamensis TaxID=1522189 RepID=A0A316VVV3_9BASI|nr:Bromodomain-containing protein [Ceraceosorus guamensis]PWN41736.1 Bromodomain-containing protein [Ceraceosorus guamensis]